MQGRPAPVADPGSRTGRSSWQHGKLASCTQLQDTDPLLVPGSKGGTEPSAKSSFFWDQAVGINLPLAAFSFGLSRTLSGRGHREALPGSVEKAVGKQEGVLILQLSNPGGVDEVELAFLELSRRFSCCVSLLTLSQTHRTAPALPATHHLVSVACLSFRGSPSSAYGDVSSTRTRVQSIGGYLR